MKIRILFIILGFLACGQGFAFYSSSDPEQPKMYHNQPGFPGTSDDAIKNKIRNVLSSEFRPYEIDDVAFTVLRGNVTLTGTIETLGNKKRLESQIKRIDGVNQIDNRLEVIKK